MEDFLRELLCLNSNDPSGGGGIHENVLTEHPDKLCIR